MADAPSRDHDARALLALGPGAQSASGAGLADRVDVFAGTEPGTHTFGGGHNFPGATLPFGMVQWGPDTIPAERHSGGYDYRDRHISGFSLTHLSGAGCALYGDFPFLPTTEPIEASPAARGGGLSGRFQPGFSHAGERARPGLYSVRLNPVGGRDIDTALTATTRTGMARFTFPRSPHASVLIDAGGSAKADDLAEVQVDPDGREISGTASSGLFCAQRPRYRVYFDAVFNRPFDASGTWTRQKLAPGSTVAADEKPASTVAADSAQAGAYASFDTRHNRIVTVRVGVSFVSVADARANLAAESGGASLRQIESAAEASWNRALASIRVGGGSRADVETFYTALYHALLAPRTFNDAGGRYIGMDGVVHDAGGRTQYADLSGWDIYRTQIPLLAMLMPRPGERHRRLDARRRGAERLPAALVLRQRAEHDDGRRPGRPDDRLGGGLRRHGASTPARRWPRWSRGASEGCAAPTAATSSARASPRTGRWATCRSTSTSGGATRTRCSATPTRSGPRPRPRSSTRSPTSRSPSSPPARSAIRPPTTRLSPVQATGATSSTPTAARSSRASKMAPSLRTTTTCTAPASPRATRPSTRGWSRRTPPASSPRSAAGRAP